jgi:Family of unknown function (DUF6518)
MRRHILLRTVLLLLVICAFGTVDAIVKGHHGGARNAIGNASAPWVLIPFLSAVFLKPRLYLGALVGAASTAAALGSYLIARAVSGFDLGPHSRGESAALITSRHRGA